MKKLERKLTLLSVVAISIGGMLGSGIFVLPGIAAVKTGPSIWLAYLLAAICILPAALSKSELASAMPTSGGAYVYIERAFGPIMGTVSGIGLWISLLLKSSFALVGFGAYLLVLINIPLVYIKYISLGFLALIMLLNIFGVKKVGKVQLVVVILSLLGLVSLLFMGIPIVDKQMLSPFLTNGTGGLISTIAFVYISYAGVTKIAAIAGEVKNPSKNIPLAMMLSLLIISAIYVSITYTLVGNIPLGELGNDIKPIHTLALILGGPKFAYIIAGIGVITLISMANSGVLASSRFPFAMAIDKLLPKQMTKVHQKHLTPINTIILTCLIMALVILFLDVEKIAKLASAFKVSMFILVNICVIVLRETAVQWYAPEYKSPLYPYVQLFGVISGFILLFYLGMMPLIAILLISIIGIIIYYTYGINASRTGVLKRYGHMPASYLLFRKKRNYTHLKELEDKEREELVHINIDKDAGVIVPLLGNELSPETLIELGASLNSKEKIQALNITEVPDQTSLDAFREKRPKTKSLELMVKTLSNRMNLNINFESIATHKLSDTMQALSEVTNIDWLILSWNGRAYNGIFFNNPIGWIVSHINSNFALFKCNGVMRFDKVLLAIRPNSKDSVKLIETTNKLCKYYNAKFTLLHVVAKDTDPKILESIKANANKELEGTRGNVLLVPSENPIETVSELTAEHDLLVLGTPRKDTWVTILFGTGKDKFAINSACSVLRLTIKS
ncbi:MAG: amino acid permease [Flavobacteriales bacterium]|nr:amino acid permease [Flavobacteriales bacterium]